MRNNPSGLTYLYGSNQGRHHTFRIAVEMREAIDGAALRKAVDVSIRRYPYFSIELVLTEDDVLHKVVPNSRPIVIVDGVMPVLLNSEESNRHLLSLAYAGNTVYFDMSHSLADGTGAMEFVKTTLYYYICEKYGEVFPTDHIRTLNTPITGEELTDPYLNFPGISEKPLGGFPGTSPAFTLEDYGISLTGADTLFRMSVDEKAFMKYSRENDGSPATMTAAFLAKALYRLRSDSDSDKPIRIALPYNNRLALHTPLAHHSLVESCAVTYPSKAGDWSIEKLGTVTRGAVALQSDPSNMRAMIYAKVMFLDKLRAAADLETVKSLCAESGKRGLNVVSSVISYVGKLPLGVLEDFIESMYSCVQGFSGWIIEMNAAGGKLCYAICQAFSEDIFVKALADEMRREGIEVELGGAEPLIYPKIKT